MSSDTKLRKKLFVASIPDILAVLSYSASEPDDIFVCIVVPEQQYRLFSGKFVPAIYAV